MLAQTLNHSFDGIVSHSYRGTLALENERRPLRFLGICCFSKPQRPLELSFYKLYAMQIRTCLKMDWVFGHIRSLMTTQTHPTIDNLIYVLFRIAILNPLVNSQKA